MTIDRSESRMLKEVRRWRREVYSTRLARGKELSDKQEQSNRLRDWAERFGLTTFISSKS